MHLYCLVQKAENCLSQLVQVKLHYMLMLFVFISFACREQKLLQESLWWRWLAAEGHGGTALCLWAGGKRKQEWDLQWQLVLGLRWEKVELPCGLQRCSGFHHLHWLPEEEAGLLFLSVSGERIKNIKMVQKPHSESKYCHFMKRFTSSHEFVHWSKGLCNNHWICENCKRARKGTLILPSIALIKIVNTRTFI